MKNRNRLTNILIAGTLTVVLLSVFLGFRNGQTTAAEANNSEETALVNLTAETDSDVAALQAQIESLQTQNAAYQEQNEELRTAVQTLQERESAYQAQIESANQMISDLSAQSNGLAMGAEGLGNLPPRPHEHNH